MRFAKASQVFVIALIVSLVGAAMAQSSVPPNHVSDFADTSMLQPPPGAAVAIMEWEDLECPYCAHAFPLVQAAVKLVYALDMVIAGAAAVLPDTAVTIP